MTGIHRVLVPTSSVSAGLLNIRADRPRILPPELSCWSSCFCYSTQLKVVWFSSSVVMMSTAVSVTSVCRDVTERRETGSDRWHRGGREQIVSLSRFQYWSLVLLAILREYDLIFGQKERTLDASPDPTVSGSQIQLSLVPSTITPSAVKFWPPILVQKLLNCRWVWPQQQKLPWHPHVVPSRT